MKALELNLTQPACLLTNANHFQNTSFSLLGPFISTKLTFSFFPSPPKLSEITLHARQISKRRVCAGLCKKKSRHTFGNVVYHWLSSFLFEKSLQICIIYRLRRLRVLELWNTVSVYYHIDPYFIGINVKCHWGSLKSYSISLNGAVLKHPKPSHVHPFLKRVNCKFCWHFTKRSLISQRKNYYHFF